MTDLDAWYQRVAVEALDRVENLGRCTLEHVDDAPRLRAAVRREARRRRVKVETIAGASWRMVWVEAREPSVVAAAYTAATVDAVRSWATGLVAADLLGTPRPAPEVDPDAAVIDAAEPLT
jgi:hypothetical protein